MRSVRTITASAKKGSVKVVSGIAGIVIVVFLTEWLEKLDREN